MKITQGIVIVFSFILCRCSVSAQQSPTEQYINQLGAKYLANSEAVGLSIGVFNHDEMTDYHFGRVKKGTGKRPTSHTIYEIGSITKVFASTLLAYAVLENKVKLDDDIRQYLPGNYPNLSFGGHSIRLIHLANLTSGLPNWLPDNTRIFQTVKQDSIPYALLDQHRDYTKQQFYKDLHTVNLTSAPGINPRHSNTAAQLLGFILEDLYNKPFAELVKQYIAGPLKMNNTVMQPVRSANLAAGYNGKGIPMPYLDTKDLQASSELTSTISDMLKFLKYQLNPKNAAARLTHQRTVSGKQDTVGLNWHLDGLEGGQKTIWHTGGTFGFSSYIVLYPDQHIGIVLMANESDADTQNKLATIASQIIAHIREQENIQTR